MRTKANKHRAHERTALFFFLLLLFFSYDAHAGILRRLQIAVTAERSRSRVYSHGHFKLIQPLLLQLPGFKKELEASVSLLVSHVEAVAPLWR